MDDFRHFGRDLMEQPGEWFKNDPGDSIWWLDNSDEAKGEWVFSFDKEKSFNMFEDYPHNLTAKQRATFNAENPYWAEFFSDR